MNTETRRKIKWVESWEKIGAFLYPCMASIANKHIPDEVQSVKINGQWFMRAPEQMQAAMEHEWKEAAE